MCTLTQKVAGNRNRSIWRCTWIHMFQLASQLSNLFSFLTFSEPSYVMRECTSKKTGTFCHKVPAIPGFMDEHELCLKTCHHSECNYEPVDDKLSAKVLRKLLHLPVAENEVLKFGRKWEAIHSERWYNPPVKLTNHGFIRNDLTLHGSHPS